MSKRFACGWPDKTYIDRQGKPSLKVCPCGWIFPDKIEAAWHQKETPRPIQREFVFKRRERLPVERVRERL